MQALAVWLNFANGALELAEPVDTNGDHLADAMFTDVIEQAEAVRLNPASTNAQIIEQKNRLESINRSDEI